MKSVESERRFAVIMAGGVGSRFWPWSRRNRPKQLLALAGGSSMLEQTVERVRGFVPADNILIATGLHLREPIRRLFPWMKPASILCEPTGRNTAPCAGWSALEVRSRCKEGVIALLPADHLISPLRAFRSDLRAAFALADSKGLLVTFGIPPHEPATGYGYIRAGAPIQDFHGATSVLGFAEKPSAATARRFLKKGGYYWNSGMFVWRADTILEAIDAHLPRLGRALTRIEHHRSRRTIPAKVLARSYPRLQSISVDYGLMEAARNRAMIPARFSWSDIGSWDAAGGLWPLDRNGNSCRGELFAVDSKRNVVATNGKPVALVGVEDLAVVDAGDVLMVCRRDRSQDVRAVLVELKRQKREDLL